MRLARRQFLRTVTGGTLGLPFLPSLFPRGAQAAPGERKFFVGMTSEHGAVRGASFNPGDGMLDRTHAMHAGHDVRFGAFKPTINGTATELSPVLRAPSTLLTPTLLAKMNLLRGFDLGYYIGHHTGGHLGNFARADQGPVGPATATIDQVMAWSTAVYPDLVGVVDRSIVTGNDFRGISWVWANGPAKSGGIQKAGVSRSSTGLFDRLIARNMKPAATPRAPIVDAVRANYRSLRESNRRLSADDRMRLDAHITRLDDLDRRLKAMPSTSAGCQQLVRPAADTQGMDRDRGTDKRFYQLLNDVIVMAFSCGSSRIASMCITGTFVSFGGSWHQDVAHKAGDPNSQRLLIESHQKTFEYVLVDLASKLDAVADAPGRTLLDQTLVQWTMEAGPETHEMYHMPIVTFGGAGGAMKTGMYVDYRNRTKSGRAGEHFGVLYRQWLATALQVMGIKPAEYEMGGRPGYGAYRVDGGYQGAVAPGVVSRCGDPLPVIT